MENWPTQATDSEDIIRRWWSGSVDYVVGLAAGPSGLIVVDVDIHDEDENGFESMGRLAEALGQPHDWLDRLSLVSRSGGGGQHHLFSVPPGVDFSKRKIGWLPGVDVLVGASFVILPPSPHPSGQEYAWLRGPDDFDVEPLPEPLLRHLLATMGEATPVDAATELADLLTRGSSSGSRNQDLIRLIGWLRRTVGDDQEARAEIRRRLEAWRDRCTPPYRGTRENEEFERTWDSGLSLDHEERNPNWPIAGRTEEEGALTLLSPFGLAKWLEPRVGGRLRYRRDMAEMLVWDGKAWVSNDVNDDPLWPRLQAWGMPEQLHEEVERAAVMAENERAAGAIRAWRTRALDRRYFSEAALTLATSPGRSVTRDELDPHPERLHVANGVVDLRTGELMPHDPALLNTALCPFDYSPDAASPRLATQLETMFPGDPEMQAYLRRAVGASLFGDNRAKAMFVLRGPADTAKSTLLQALLRVLGAGTRAPYGDVGDKKLFVTPRGDQHPAGLANALQYRLVLMSEEYGERDKLNMPLLKAITGNDRLTARFMRQDFWSGVARCTPWLATNHDLRVGEFDEAVRIRLKVIDVPGVIPLERRRDGVVTELVQEGEGLLAWAIRGAMEYIADGLRDPTRVKDAVRDLVDGQDRVLAYVEECLIPWGEDWTEEQLSEHGVPAFDLYGHYQAWCAKEGAPPLYANEFYKRLRRPLGIVGKDLPRARSGGQLTRRWPVYLR